ncbi:DNA (cytosine-5-)-methyltransferase [Subsaximicrobium wynnwilliamsii]|jgi:DNA (cytosine-5)-methyltransferase 1|uniref:Cytosine-specific methyltransferase n=1 Tax=Subsaximicrobium wynnwilliamsii TaxID=291179 RepID=A0A5C6ZGR0_9FLAO|nr:DNA (cytosine-5-)-methyltransferase [Subsaximicrobium wynnwilliamsii]TXD82401.1 DNA (cytosine-5-)-methyltransferase [Subsaximicrobium wynnwilliamsii]TXD88043.1 DNA (cytosine-5-)-methyltransferase [Subsaximicrobium wynnwilliamsii]TXE02095.1 DNA (cytosine-5-)-methyltransferase [Subsaximicrobium wynnwilliamsii]
MVIKEHYSLSEAAEILGKSKETLRRWDRDGKLTALREPISEYRLYKKEEIDSLIKPLFDNIEDETDNSENPIKEFKVLELFAGAGGLAIGLEKAGITCAALNEIDKWACQTLRENRPHWNVLEGDIKNYNFEKFNGKVDIVTGGFPCQAFSYAGKKLGLEDARGTLFYEFARAVQEVNPPICIGENVKGLLSHEKGDTLRGMISILDEIGYNVVPVKVLKAVNYKVPQKRERLIVVGVRKDIDLKYEYPQAYQSIYNLSDALKKGKLYDSDVPKSEGSTYPEHKKAVLDLIPPKGYWRDLPLDLQKEYMGKSFYLGGGKTGMARRIGWDEPSLTLTCSPAQKQTERCHPEETRPFTVREYARIQTFPDEWKFMGSVSQQYKQIGNAVPCNLGKEIGYSIIKFLNAYYLSESKPK